MGKLYHMQIYRTVAQNTIIYATACGKFLSAGKHKVAWWWDQIECDACKNIPVYDELMIRIDAGGENINHADRIYEEYTNFVEGD